MNNFNKKLYYICDVDREGTAYFHSDLANLRKNFFENGKSDKIKKDITELGSEGKLNANIGKKKLKWKKKIGKIVTEEVFQQGKNFVLVRRDLNGSIICKITFDIDLNWIRTDYFSPESYTQAEITLKPSDSGDYIERYNFDSDSKSYKKEKLAPTKLEADEFGLYNSDLIENAVLVSNKDGNFTYSNKKETAKTDNGSTILIMNAWEIKDGEVPQSAKHEEPEITFKNLDDIAEIEETESENEEVPQEETDSNAVENSEGTASEEVKTEVIDTNKPIIDIENIIVDELIDNQEETNPQEEVSEKAEENKVVPSEETTETALETKEAEFTSKLAISHGKYIYTGDTVDGKREGLGRTESAEGITLYSGEYHDNKRSGVGTAYFPNGKLSFAGNWDNDKKNGVGISFRPSDGSVHIANWSNGKPSENVTLVDGKGNMLYTGNIVEGKKNGTGIQKDAETGYTYIGEFADGKPNGTGSLFDENGKLLYNGSWKDGEKDGKGTEFDASGAIVYSGEWKNGNYLNGILYQKI